MFDPVNIILRTVAVYLFILLAIRLFGKREVAQLSMFDLVFILLISNSVQNAMVGSDSSLLGGIIAALSLFAVNFIFETVLLKSRTASKFLQGEAIMLVYQGRVLEKHLMKAKISRDELDEAIREHGVRQVSDVNLAVLEQDGNISVLSDDFKRRTSKRRRAKRALQQNQ